MAMNRITENILLGSHFALSAQKTLRREKVSHVLSLVQSGVKPEHVAEFKHLQISIDDIEDENILKYFPQIIQFIDEAVQQGTTILVHCMAGVSRSATAVCAYLMHVRIWGVEETIDFVKGKRSVIRPNASFLEQLHIFYDCGFEVDETKAPYRRWLLKQKAEDITMKFESSNNKIAYTSESLSHMPRGSELASQSSSRKCWRMALPPIMYGVKQTRPLPEEFDIARIMAPKRPSKPKRSSYSTSPPSSPIDGSGGSEAEIEGETGEQKYLNEEATDDGPVQTFKDNDDGADNVTAAMAGASLTATATADDDTTDEESDDDENGKPKPKLPFKLKKKPKPKALFLILASSGDCGVEKEVLMSGSPSEDLKGIESPVLKLRVGHPVEEDHVDHVLVGGHQLLDAIYAKSGAAASSGPSGPGPTRATQLRCKKCSCPLALSGAFIIHEAGAHQAKGGRFGHPSASSSSSSIDSTASTNGSTASGNGSSGATNGGSGLPKISTKNLAFSAHTINGHRIPSVRQNLAHLASKKEHSGLQRTASLTSMSQLNARCMHFFIEPVNWMRPELEKGALEGKLNCPRCQGRVGAYHWQGMKCSCGVWVTPAISLQRSRVDEVPVHPARTNSSVL